MPWCPECGAEYREGMETCAKCRVALEASPPPAREDPTRAALVRLLRAARPSVVEALSYAAGGWRVLRRHRALLLVPLLTAERSHHYLVALVPLLIFGREVLSRNVVDRRVLALGGAGVFFFLYFQEGLPRIALGALMELVHFPGSPTVIGGVLLLVALLWGVERGERPGDGPGGKMDPPSPS